MRIYQLGKLIVLPLFVACSGSTVKDADEPDAQPDVQTDVGKTDGQQEAQADVASEPEPCVPEGSWNLTLIRSDGVSTQEQIQIAADGGQDETTHEIVFVDRVVPTNSCTYPDASISDAAPETQTARGTLEESSCTLRLGFTNRWGSSGEDQCEQFNISLSFQGDRATGGADSEGGWCLDKGHWTWEAKATRIP